MSKKTVTMKGNILNLCGDVLTIGSKIPDCRLIKNDLSEVKLSDYQGKILVISCVPSLDTPVCDKQTRTFNEKAAHIADNVEILTVSMDLPFAQGRWCGSAGIDRVTTLSDYRYREFAEKTGMMIAELQLIARGIFIVDADRDVRYIQIVEEISEEPDYEAVIRALSEIK